MALDPGALDVLNNFINDDCMAKFMEDAMPEPTTPEDSGKRGRRLFLIAIATGVVNYLKAHDGDSFKISVEHTGGDNHQATLEIV